MLKKNYIKIKNILSYTHFGMLRQIRLKTLQTIKEKLLNFPQTRPLGYECYLYLHKMRTKAEHE